MVLLYLEAQIPRQWRRPVEAVAIVKPTPLCFCCIGFKTLKYRLRPFTQFELLIHSQIVTHSSTVRIKNAKLDYLGNAVLTFGNLA